MALEINAVCDRCGFKQRVHSGMSLPEYWKKIAEYFICSECYENFKHWFEDGLKRAAATKPSLDSEIDFLKEIGTARPSPDNEDVPF